MPRSRIANDVPNLKWMSLKVDVRRSDPCWCSVNAFIRGNVAFPSTCTVVRWRKNLQGYMCFHLKLNVCMFDKWKWLERSDVHVYVCVWGGSNPCGRGTGPSQTQFSEAMLWSMSWCDLAFSTSLIGTFNLSSVLGVGAHTAHSYQWLKILKIYHRYVGRDLTLINPCLWMNL